MEKDCRKGVKLNYAYLYTSKIFYEENGPIVMQPEFGPNGFAKERDITSMRQVSNSISLSKSYTKIL